MHAHGFLDLALVFLVAAVVAVPLFRHLGLSAVLGYLAAGVAIGPDGFAMVTDPETPLAFAEFGVVMLLFIIGLELSPPRLWVMRRQVFGIGGLQVGLSALALGGLLLWLGSHWKAALVLGLGLALSSTAVGLQLLGERREIGHRYGRIAFAILLFQDIIAIPLLAAIPLLGAAAAAGQPAPSGGAILKAVAIIALVVVGGRYVLRQLFRVVARARSVEVFTAAALLVVAGNAWLMQQAGLSMGLGAFIAGVLLADSEFRHELESHIEPFKGLLLGLFFMAVGMSIDLGRIAAEPALVAAGVAGLIAIKGGLLMLVGRAAGLRVRESLMLATVLSMGGEFAFVVFAEASRAGLLAAAERDLLVAVVGLSMAATPLVLLAVSRWLREHPEAREARPEDPIDHEHPRVIIAGFGRVGQIVGRLLTAARIPYTALENSAEQVDFSRRFGSKIYYGDPARPELLRAAHAERAEVFVVTTDDPEANVRTARLVKQMYPHLKVFARARNRQHAFALMDLGAEVTRETFHSSLEMGRLVMQALGVEEAKAARDVARFREHDEQLLREQHLFYDDEAALVASAKEARIELAALFDADREADREADRDAAGEARPAPRAD